MASENNRRIYYTTRREATSPESVSLGYHQNVRRIIFLLEAPRENLIPFPVSRGTCILAAQDLNLITSRSVLLAHIHGFWRLAPGYLGGGCYSSDHREYSDSGSMDKLVRGVGGGVQTKVFIQLPGEPWLLPCTWAASAADPACHLAGPILFDPQEFSLLATAPQAQLPKSRKLHLWRID